MQGVIRRRLLINFRVAPHVMQKLLPDRFRPKLHDGFAIAGICLIRLEAIRPKHVPTFAGLSSENGAHRIAVVWDDGGTPREGVYIPRRDTNSLVNHIAGGRVFPGEHHHADFDVTDDGERIALTMRAKDDGVVVDVRARRVETWPSSSGFESLDAASTFFEGGSVGYSVKRDLSRLDGITLKTASWKVDALEVEHVRSSFFDDETSFPKGSIDFDCGLVMRDIDHEWHSEPELVI